MDASIRSRSAIITIAIHVALFLILLFSVMTISIPPFPETGGGGGVLVSIGTLEEASGDVQPMADRVTKDPVADKVKIITTKFVSLVNSFVEIHDFLPEQTASESGSKADLSGVARRAKPEPYVVYDPNVATLIETLAPMYIENRVYQSMQESTTSELAARMTAMSNATNNARDVIKKLTLAYNKARQASITQEISEIVGGAAALSS